MAFNARVAERRIFITPECEYRLVHLLSVKNFEPHEQVKIFDCQTRYTIKDAVKLTGISRTRLYEELKNGRLTAKKVGRSTLIPHESIETWLKNLDAYSAPKP